MSRFPRWLKFFLSAGVIRYLCGAVYCEKCDVKLKRLHLFGGIFHHI